MLRDVDPAQAAANHFALAIALRDLREAHSALPGVPDEIWAGVAKNQFVARVARIRRELEEIERLMDAEWRFG